MCCRRSTRTQHGFRIPARTTASASRLHLVLPAATTSALLNEVPAAFHARIDDVLLTALALTVAEWRRGRDFSDGGPIVVDVEGQGRETVMGGIDLSQTVGRFTWCYPVCLDPGELELDDAIPGGAYLGDVLKKVKEQSRAIPGGGLSYELVHYSHSEAAASLAQVPPPQISFTYLGRVLVVSTTTGHPPLVQLIRSRERILKRISTTQSR